MSESEFINKVKDKLEIHKVNDVVKQIETPPTKELKIDIPQTPFESSDGESEYESNELDFSQNVLFNKFLKKNGFDNFGDWWKREGKDRILEMIDYGRRNNNHIDYKDEIGWWNKWFRKNSDKILYRIIWGDTDGKRITK